MTHRLIKMIAISVLLTAFAVTTLAQVFKKGTYSASSGGVKWSIKYDDGGKVTVSRDGTVVVEGSYKVAGDELEVTDEKGPMACGKDYPGKYKWKLEGKRLVLTAVQDECEGRANALTSQTWEQE